MRTFVLLATVAAVASAQSSSLSSLSSASGSSSLSADLEAIPECNTTQLNDAETTLTSNQREAQCETALGLQSGTMLQVTTAQASKMCDTTSCKAALQELYSELPNCRYNLWGLQYSAKKLLNYCGITATNTTDSSSDSTSGSASWSATSSSASFAPVGATDAPSTASSTTTDSSAGSSAASTTATVSAALAATVGLVAAFLA
ncbi:hypothetical protein PF005_g46 [Phytophthora fragariae]|uniref:Elicitin-like protein n=1 Tax=Phytophthora fragariae TaxID=53985 RepID=A0A6A3ZPT2_9STRA|nr:hypothetical protein PF003_g5701 [Phytophthora fragariae]KAE8950471.1 hypothetical protein PF009_g44 [Phytophthora fragariae]KAE9031090.1 hypothetical protein PF011_g290 [Phytophthora fragariae]KAE9141592.1 hypothetical protein PF007_g88 [Phytophthora fragariae]KAE9156092.1 hypothetical protein PF006_g45 [Phytophthora fragariae]